MAFFRLLALSMSCSRGRNIWGRAGQAEPRARAPVELEPQPPPAPSPSSASSAMVGGGVGREDEACDSSSRVLSRESSFSLRTEHWAGNRGRSGGVPPHSDGPRPRGPGTHLLGHDLRLLRALGGLLVGLPDPCHEVLHSLTEHSAGGDGGFRGAVPRGPPPSRGDAPGCQALTWLTRSPRSAGRRLGSWRGELRPSLRRRGSAAPAIGPGGRATVTLRPGAPPLPAAWGGGEARSTAPARSPGLGGRAAVTLGPGAPPLPAAQPASLHTQLTDRGS